MTWVKLDDTCPLEALPIDTQERIAAAVALPYPPPAWIRIQCAMVRSRAWYEWYKQRGRSPQTPRPKISASVRAEVMARDEGKCQICGTTDQPTLDHIVPFSLNGADTPDNLRVLCRPCNSRRGNRV